MHITRLLLVATLVDTVTNHLGAETTSKPSFCFSAASVAGRDENKVLQVSDRPIGGVSNVTQATWTSPSYEERRRSWASSYRFRSALVVADDDLLMGGDEFCVTVMELVYKIKETFPLK
jgi:hypothetical protein